MYPHLLVSFHDLLPKNLPGPKVLLILVQKLINQLSSALLCFTAHSSSFLLLQCCRAPAKQSHCHQNPPLKDNVHKAILQHAVLHATKASCKQTLL